MSRSLLFPRAIRSAIALAVLAIAASSSRPAAQAARPNVVLIISDDHGWTDYGFMGHPTVRTPNLDTLASQSLLFTRGYVPTALCRPSLATLATGLYPHQHGMTSNDPPGGTTASQNPAARASMVDVFGRHRTLPAMLGEQGYVSLQTGKWWEGDPTRQGFTAAMTHGDVTRGGRHGDQGLTVGRTGLQPVYDFVDGAVKAQKPFFLWYAPFMPHTPHNPPERLLASYKSRGLPAAVAGYLASVEWFDETIGQLLGHLERVGVASNTLVLYVSDNGWLQAEAPALQGLTPGKMSPYDAGIRSPIMARWPGRIRSARDERTLASSLDVVPTILRAAGLTPPAAMPGLDLGDAAALARRRMLFGALFAHTAVDVTRPVANLKYRTIVRDDGWKLILPYAPNRDVVLTIDGKAGDWTRRPAELFNVLEDPRETRDRASERADLVRELGATIDAWWTMP